MDKPRRGAPEGTAEGTAEGIVVRVLPDQPAIHKTFDYLLPSEMASAVQIGDEVRVPLHGRRVGGWVVEIGSTPPPGVQLVRVARLRGRGPSKEILELASWAAWRWAGHPASFLRTASPPAAVRQLPGSRGPAAPLPGPVDLALAADAEQAILSAGAGGMAVLRLPPVSDVAEVALVAARRGNALLLVPSVARAKHLAIRLRRAGAAVALMPGDWAQARAGATVVGARAAAWAPVGDLAVAVIFDEHDEAYQEERTPTWHARDVLAERCRRAGVPLLAVSPSPSLEALAAGRLHTLPRRSERQGWPVVQVVDRRREDVARTGLYSPQLVRVLRSEVRVVCVLNRKGRSRLLACGTCGEVATCERCGTAVQQTSEGALVCKLCGIDRPVVCSSCGAMALRNLRVGVSRAREELEALAGEPVTEVTGSRVEGDVAARVLVGTEAVLHQVEEAGVVAFLDFDQELVAPRYRASEQAFALLVRAARVTGAGRAGGGARGRILVQTRLPRHEVLVAAVQADPGRLAEAERRRRKALGYPPFGALAEVSGEAAESFVERLGRPMGVEVRGPVEGRWLLRAPDHRVLCDALKAVSRPAGRLRLAVDPPRV